VTRETARPETNLPTANLTELHRVQKKGEVQGEAEDRPLPTIHVAKPSLLLGEVLVGGLRQQARTLSGSAL